MSTIKAEICNLPYDATMYFYHFNAISDAQNVIAEFTGLLVRNRVCDPFDLSASCTTKYGPWDNSSTILGVEFNQKGHSQIWYPWNGKNVII